MLCEADNEPYSKKFELHKRDLVEKLSNMNIFSSLLMGLKLVSPHQTSDVVFYTIVILEKMLKFSSGDSNLYNSIVNVIFTKAKCFDDYDVHVDDILDLTLSGEFSLHSICVRLCSANFMKPSFYAAQVKFFLQLFRSINMLEKEMVETVFNSYFFNIEAGYEYLLEIFRIILPVE
jgi:hypothetical protein